jgi:hypothetical protein
MRPSADPRMLGSGQLVGYSGLSRTALSVRT